MLYSGWPSWNSFEASNENTIRLPSLRVRASQSSNQPRRSEEEFHESESFTITGAFASRRGPVCCASDVHPQNRSRRCSGLLPSGRRSERAGCSTASWIPCIVVQSPRNRAMAAWSAGYRAAWVRRRLTPEPISSLLGTAGLWPFTSCSTSFFDKRKRHFAFASAVAA
jgi:hypothetical protein